MSWLDLVFLHWPVDPKALRALIPPAISVDLWQDAAWIGIVPFRMTDVAPRFFPSVPWLSAFPELNVRTYVTVDGKPGVWFFSLDATNPIAVRTARTFFHLPYMDAEIECKRKQNWIEYRSQRREKSSSAKLHVAYRPLGTPQLAETGTLEHFLTARYCLYSADSKGRVYRGEINHDPWKLSNGEANIHHNTMTQWLGVELPDSEPTVHTAEDMGVVAWGITAC